MYYNTKKGAVPFAPQWKADGSYMRYKNYETKRNKQWFAHRVENLELLTSHRYSWWRQPLLDSRVHDMEVIFTVSSFCATRSAASWIFHRTSSIESFFIFRDRRQGRTQIGSRQLDWEWSRKNSFVFLETRWICIWGEPEFGGIYWGVDWCFNTLAFDVQGKSPG